MLREKQDTSNKASRAVFFFKKKTFIAILTCACMGCIQHMFRAAAVLPWDKGAPCACQAWPAELICPWGPCWHRQASAILGGTKILCNTSGLHKDL